MNVVNQWISGCLKWKEGMLNYIGVTTYKSLNISNPK